MYKFILALIFLLIYTSTLAAQGYKFFVQPSDMWTVEGYMSDGKLSPTCQAVTRWTDGSSFHLIADLYDGEVYIMFTNKNWNVQDYKIDEAYKLKILVQKGDQSGELSGIFEMVSPDTIRIRRLKEMFIDIFAEYERLILIMPGTLSDAKISLAGTRKAMHYMNTCIKYYNVTR